jgi:hypothetical protein
MTTSFGEFHEHPTEDALELYSLNRIPNGSELDTIEEHLLICRKCQDQLESADKYNTAMRQALLKLERDKLKPDKV